MAYLVLEIVICWCRYCLASLRVLTWALLHSFRILVSTYPSGIWPVVVVATSIGCCVRGHGALRFQHGGNVRCSVLYPVFDPLS